MSQPVFHASMAVSASGHSLLALLLDAHPQIRHTGDTILRAHLNQRAQCACGQPFMQCEFWGALRGWPGYAALRDEFQGGPLKTLFSLPSLFPLQKLMYAASPALQRYTAHLLDYPAQVRALTGAPLAFFGRKRLADLLLPLAAGAPARVLHLTKHPLAQVISFRKRTARARQSLADLGREWRFYNQRVVQAAWLRPDTAYLHIRYEDLCAAPQATLTHICEFLGLDFHPDMLRPGEVRPGHVLGARSLVGAAGEKFPGIRPPDLSFEALSAAEQAAVWRVTAPLAQRLGYHQGYTND